MSEFITPLLQWLNTHPQLAVLATFIISAAESVAIIGTIVPGSIMMTALGTLAGAGVIPLWETIFWAIMGAIIGDGISYWIGHYFKDRLPLLWPFRRYPTLLRTGEAFFYKYGSMSVFIGRFVGPVRALVPLVAGMLGMKPLHFIAANVASAILWAPAYMLPGILLGAASLELPPDIAMHVMLVLTLISLFITLCAWLLYKLIRHINYQINQIQTHIWHRLQKSRFFSPATVLLKHYDTKQTHGQFNLALLFIITFSVLLLLVLYVQWYGPQNLTMNEMVYHLLRGLSLRSEVLDSAMINLTLLGEKTIFFALGFMLALWLIYTKRLRAAKHLIALVLLTAGVMYILKHTIPSPRPWGILHPSDSYSLPSGHTGFSAAIYFLIAFLIGSHFSLKGRKRIYTLTALLVLTIGFSRLYLGTHWLTDIIASLLLVACIFIGTFISYQRQYEEKIKPLPIFLVSLITLSVVYPLWHYHKFDKLKLNYTQIEYPIVVLSSANWWERNGELSSYHTSLFGVRSQRINVEWQGGIKQINETLLKAGWSEPPPRNLVSILHRMADISSVEYLPLISPQYLDQKPVLILTRMIPNKINGKKTLLVIRLWQSNRNFKETGQPLWVGFIGVVPRAYGWLFLKHPGEIDIEASTVFPVQIPKNEWETKRITIMTPNKHRLIPINVLLIKPLRWGQA